jgi:predicted nucleic acid-binding protein
MNFTYGFLVSGNLYSLEESKVILEEIFGTTWEMHIPVWSSVFDMQYKLEYQNSITDAEFLALAEDLNYTFITTDEQLVQKVRAASLKVKVLLVTDHPWAQLGDVDEFPIDS